MAPKTNNAPVPETELVDPFQAPENYADKDELFAKKLKFDIDKITYETGTGYQGADRWISEVRVFRTEEDGTPYVTEELLTFGPNEGRDPVMVAAQKYLEAKPLQGYSLNKSGNAYYINKAK